VRLKCVVGDDRKRGSEGGRGIRLDPFCSLYSMDYEKKDVSLSSAKCWEGQRVARFAHTSSAKVGEQPIAFPHVNTRLYPRISTPAQIFFFPQQKENYPLSAL